LGTVNGIRALNIVTSSNLIVKTTFPHGSILKDSRTFPVGKTDSQIIHFDV